MKKGDKTRNRILDIARSYFARSGYASVTMKDICDETNLSRGGLYRHFSSVKNIFIALLEKNIEDTKVVEFDSPTDYLCNYLQQEKQSIFSSESGLYFTALEFGFIEKDQSVYFQTKVNEDIDYLSRILHEGQIKGEFKDFNCNNMSHMILHYFNSVKSTSTFLEPTESDIDNQIELIKKLILVKQK